MNADSPPTASFGKKLGELIKRKRQAMGLTQLQLAEDAYGSGTRTRRISELENGTVDNPQAKTIDPVIHALRITEDELHECAAGAGWSPNVDLDRAYREARNLIESAAAQFEHARPDASLADLEDYLRSKALEWRQLKDRFAKIENIENGIGDLLSQARTALSDGNFSEADRVLLQAEDHQQTNKTLEEISKQAEIRILRADAFLFSENPDQAHELYYTACKFFDPFKPEITIEMLTGTARRVYESSLRSLMPRFEIARRLLDALAEHPLVKSDPHQSGLANYRRGLIYMNEATKRDGYKTNTELLQQSMQYARRAVESFPVGSSAEFCVYSRISLANILQKSSESANYNESLEEAITILKIARAVASDDVKGQLANIGNALGGIYIAQSQIASIENRHILLNNAIIEFTVAMNESETTSDFSLWGAARMNRGRVLSQMAQAETADIKKKHFLHMRAISEFYAALETHLITPFPERFAGIHIELAEELSRSSNGKDEELKLNYLSRGLDHLHLAKNFFVKDSYPHFWIKIHIDAGNIFAKLGMKGSDHTDIERECAKQAKECFDEAATTYDAIGNVAEAARCREAVEKMNRFIFTPPMS